jgi:hypothetical protein
VKLDGGRIMAGHCFRRLILVTFAAVLTPLSGAIGQEQRPPAGLAALETPHALRMEHRHLRDDLARAVADGEGVGDVARAIERTLIPHLKREEESVLRLLGLLPGLARDESIPNSAGIIATAEQFERELPQLQLEHRTIYEATKRLRDVIRRERKPQYQDFADRLWLHVRLDEEVLYPAAIVVGRYVKMSEDPTHRPTSRPNQTGATRRPAGASPRP